MKCQPNRNYKSNDVVMTPKDLATKIIDHFYTSGTILEPCRGSGSFMTEKSDWCEISEGRDFLEAEGHWDWIITNPPWSKIKDFLKKSFAVSDNVVFLMTINHVFTKARLKIMKENGFGIKEIMLVDMPKEFPQMGFQLGAIYYKRGYIGDIKLTSIHQDFR